jgi:carboxyl-terminal processing protease
MGVLLICFLALLAHEATSLKSVWGVVLNAWKSTIPNAKTVKKLMVSTVLSGSLLSPLASFGDDGARGKLYEEVWSIVNENFVDENFNGNNWNDVKIEYENILKNGGDESKTIDSMLKRLGDKYTRLLDKQFFESLWEYDAIGVGLLFKSDPGQPMVIAGPPITGSSGEAAGLKKGDNVYSINGKATQSMTAMQVLDMLSNDKSDTLSLEYSDSNDKTSTHKIIQLARSKQQANNPIQFTSQKVSNGMKIGYIKLSEFNAEAVPSLKNAINSLNNENIDELVLDLRGNTGGGFQFALNIGGMFMDHKVMVNTAGRGKDTSSFLSSYPDGVIYSKPLILFTDGLSASASEVLAGGLRDNCRAVLVGSKTFGKGKIQAVFGLANGGGLTLTVAQYVTPKGTVIQSRGLEPDIAISTLDPYVGYLLGPAKDILSKPDLNKIDYNKANEIQKTCSSSL